MIDNARDELARFPIEQFLERIPIEAFDWLVARSP
jgi:hypothetical protein